MRKQGAYIVTFNDGTKSIHYWGDRGWHSFGVRYAMTDEELDFKSIEWIEGQE